MKSDNNTFDRYLLALRKTPIDEKTEHTDRAALQDLLQAIANEDASGIAVQHEPKRIAGKGAPDFKVTKSGLILGYVENKAIGENLGKVLKSDQIAKYKSLSDNIILTDYLQFIWINKYGPAQSERLCDQTDFENPKFRLREDRAAAVGNLFKGFSRLRRRASGGRSNLRSRSLRAAGCCATISARNWCGRNASTKKGDFTDYTKFFAIRYSMN